MPVNITDEELDIFNKNGFTDDDVRATVENYRNQGLDDAAIRSKIDSRLNSWNTSAPKQQLPKETPKEETAPQINNDFTENKVLQGGIEKKVTPNWDEKGRIFYTDETGNRVELEKAPLGTRIKNWGIAKLSNLQDRANAYSFDPNGTTPNDRMYRDKTKDVAILATLPVGGLVSSGLGLSGLGGIAAAGAVDGGIYGLTSGIVDKKTPLGVLGDTVLNAGLGAGLGAGIGIATPLVGKAINYLGQKATPLFRDVIQNFGKRPVQKTANNTIAKEVANTEKETIIPTLKELKSNIQKAKFDDYKLQTVKRSKQGNYWTKSLDNAENAMTLSTREFNDIIKDLYKDPSKVLDENYIKTLEGKVEDVINRMPFNNEDRVVSEFYDKFYSAVDNAMSYANLKNGNTSYFTGIPKTESIPISEENATRGLSQSIINSKGLPKEVKEIISNDLPQYKILHNNDLTERAVVEIESDFNNELSRLSSAKDFDALDYEKSRQIAKRLFQSGRHKEAVNLMDNVAINATEKGQAIQALSLWSNMTPEGAVYKAEKLLTEYNKKNPKKVKKELTQENIDNIIKLQEDVINATDDVTKTQNMAKTAKYISELVPANLGKKLKAYRNISLLLNPKTLGRNIVGNVLFNTADTVAKGLAVPFDRAIGLVTKQKTRVLPQLNELAKGGIQGAKTGFKEALEGIDTRGLGQRFDLNSGRTFESPVGKFFETGLDIGLRVPDRMQYEATFAESVANMVKAQGLKEPTQEILEKAEQEALESVFQNQGKISDLTLALRKGLNNIGLEDFGLGDLLVPYAQTPANLAQQGINYSPLGYIKGIGNALQGNQRQASLDLARATLGTGIIGGGYALGKNKLATPSQFDDNYIQNRDIKNNLQVLGIRPDQIGDMWYAPFQPASIPLSVGIASAYGENPLQAGMNTLVDLPFLQNLARGISDIKDKGIAEAGINFAGSVPTQFVPTALSQVAQTVDPYLRETSADNKIMQGVNQAIAKIPFASKTLPQRIDVTGKPIERYSTDGVQRLFDIFINPTFINKKTDDPIVSELQNLYNETKETKHFLKTADKTLNRVLDENGKPLKLNGRQLSDYQKALGEKTYEEFDYVMGSKEYNNADAEEKIKILNDRRNAVKQLVEYEMFNIPVSKSYKNKVNKLYINMD